MTADVSDPELLSLHALRLLGSGEAAAAAARFGLDADVVAELLMDFEARGWVSRFEFAGSAGWSLTEAGKAENERLLAVELAARGGVEDVARVHAAFLPLNARFQETATRWQVRPVPGDRMALNDHVDLRWDDRVLDELGSVGRRLAPLAADLSAVLSRCAGYPERYFAARSRVERGEPRWVDAVGIDSCHVVWMQLHEDLLATLGIERGQEQ